MWIPLKRRLADTLAEQIRERFGIDHRPVVETPPRRQLGDLAFPAPLHLARELRRKPRDIAADLADGWSLPEIVREVRVEGPGYLNLFLRRSPVVARLLTEPLFPDAARRHGKVIVEHTNINPNKAAHVGHLRNAVLGDVLVRCLRRLGYEVEVQNYIDDTGVQLADVVVGFMDLRGEALADVEAAPEPFDHLCWDLYAEVGAWYEGDAERQRLRRQTLHELETGSGERAEMGRLVARRVLRCHLATMRRLGIGYDLLTYEGHILALDFFRAAFDKLKGRDAVRLEESGKNAGCWVMPLADSAEFAGLEDPDKVIVRSDGTVTYVGKDIAYQLWKFGLLGKDFAYRRWDEEGVWETALEGAADHPAFGGGERVVNVIDARQSYLQKIVRAGLEALGHEQEARRSVHFAYEMVSLSPATARRLGFLDEEAQAGEAGKSLEMSGRRGIGVKADDLVDLLEVRAREEIGKRDRELEGEEPEELARQIATAAVRFFMARATTTRVIAFDLDEALAFEGETGPCLQYSMVRVRNIRRKLEAAGLATAVEPEAVAALPEELWDDDLWDLALAVAQTEEVVEKSAETLELSLAARHALDLAQRLNAVYHRHPILQEPDDERRAARLATTQVFARGLEALADLLGVPLPERM